jgi:hypothetical protein
MVKAITPPGARVTVAPSGRVVTLTTHTPVKAMLCSLSPSQADELCEEIRAALLVLDPERARP